MSANRDLPASDTDTSRFLRLVAAGRLPIARRLVAAGADVLARDDEHDATPRGWAETSLEITRNPACAQMAEWLATIERGETG